MTFGELIETIASLTTTFNCAPRCYIFCFGADWMQTFRTKVGTVVVICCHTKFTTVCSLNAACWMQQAERCYGGNISDKQELCAPAEAERKEIQAARSREAGLEFK